MKKNLASNIALVPIFILTLITTFSFALPLVPVYAQITPDQSTVAAPPDQSVTASPGPIPTLQNPLQAKSITDILLSAVDLAIFIGVIVAVLTFIFIGFKFVMARGNDKALIEARKWFFYAVIGTAVLISSKVIVQVIENTLTSTGVVNQNIFNQQK